MLSPGISAKSLTRLSAILLVVTLIQSCHLELLDPVKNGLIADFSFVFVAETNKAPAEVIFENQSSEAVSYEWNFGDGSEVSTDANPNHTFLKGGDFNVVLKSYSDEGLVDSTIKVVSVQIPTFSRLYSVSNESIFSRIEQVSDTLYGFYGSTSEPVGTSLLLNSDGISLPFPGAFPSGQITIGRFNTPTDEGFLDTWVEIDQGDLLVSHFTEFDSGIVDIYEDFGAFVKVVSGEEGDIFIIGSSSLGLNFVLLENYRTPTSQRFVTGLGQIHDVVYSSNGTLEVLHRSQNNNLELSEVDTNGSIIRTTIVASSTPINVNWRLIRTVSGTYNAFGVIDNDQITQYTITSDSDVSTITIEADIRSIKEVIRLRDGNISILGGDILSDMTPITVLLKVTAETNVEWREEIREPSRAPIYPNRMIETSDCGFLVTATCNCFVTNDQDYIYKLNSKGEIDE